MKWAALVPELAVSDLSTSKTFCAGLLGFSVEYEREGFAYFSSNDAQLMLEQVGGHWTTGTLQLPFGRGVNLQIEVADVASLQAEVTAADWPIFLPLQTVWYCAGQIEHGQAEFIIQDPDGYLLRFCQSLGDRVLKSTSQ